MGARTRSWWRRGRTRRWRRRRSRGGGRSSGERMWCWGGGVGGCARGDQGAKLGRVPAGGGGGESGGGSGGAGDDQGGGAAEHAAGGGGRGLAKGQIANGQRAKSEPGFRGLVVQCGALG